VKEVETLPNDWSLMLFEEFKKPYYESLSSFLDYEYATHQVYPAPEDLFKAMSLTSFGSTKVAILGQDPYHGFGQANGLAFSVNKDVSIPPSLRNIFKELNNDLGLLPPSHGYLGHWAEQGVLLLNCVLSVRDGKPTSHAGHGWELLTDSVIRSLSDSKSESVVFVLWGNYAQKRSALIDTSRHFIISSTHPSPLSASRGFLGSKPFSTINNYLQSSGLTEVDWAIH
jgi:uracil-DNA glycosylase